MISPTARSAGRVTLARTGDQRRRRSPQSPRGHPRPRPGADPADLPRPLAAGRHPPPAHQPPPLQRRRRARPGHGRTRRRRSSRGRHTRDHRPHRSGCDPGPGHHRRRPAAGRGRVPRPTVLVLRTTGDRPRDWVRAGQAMERVLLTATVRGVAAGPPPPHPAGHWPRSWSLASTAGRATLEQPAAAGAPDHRTGVGHSVVTGTRRARPARSRPERPRAVRRRAPGRTADPVRAGARRGPGRPRRFPAVPRCRPAGGGRRRSARR
jgi:hypothetical protein